MRTKESIEKGIQMVMSPSELMYRSEIFHSNMEFMGSYLGLRKRLLIKSGDELLYFGRIDSAAMRKLNDWPEDITIVPTDDKPLLKDILVGLIGENIKIGAKEGAGFIYAGKCKPELLDWLYYQSDKVKWAIINKIENIEKDIYNFDAYFEKTVKNRSHCKLSETETLEVKEQLITKLKKELARYEAKRDRFLSMSDCRVTDIYRSILPEEEGTYIIIFDACMPSSGSVWTIEECNRQPVIQRDIDLYYRMAGRKEA